jgi:hypothetical protein
VRISDLRNGYPARLPYQGQAEEEIALLSGVRVPVERIDERPVTRKGANFP